MNVIVRVLLLSFQYIPLPPRQINTHLEGYNHTIIYLFLFFYLYFAYTPAL